MMDRLAKGVRYLAAEFSVEPDEFRHDNAPGGDMLLQALLSKGYAVQTRGRVAASRVGLRMLEEFERGQGDEAA